MKRLFFAVWNYALRRYNNQPSVQKMFTLLSISLRIDKFTIPPLGAEIPAQASPESTFSVASTKLCLCYCVLYWKVCTNHTSKTLTSTILQTLLLFWVISSEFILEEGIRFTWGLKVSNHKVFYGLSPFLQMAKINFMANGCVK